MMVKIMMRTEDITVLYRVMFGNDIEDVRPMTEDIENRLLTIVSEIEDADNAFKLVCRLYGIGCNKEDIKSIAEEYGITRERVRQIVEKKKRALRHKWHTLKKEEM